MKKRILFISPLPPPNYGSALSSEMCLKILNDSRKFDVENIRLNYSKKISDIGKFNIEKIRGFFKVRSMIKKTLKKFNPDVIYFVPATSSWGFKRDYLFWKQIKKNYAGKIIFHLRSRILDNDWGKKSFKRKLSKMIKNQKIILLGEELIKDLHGSISRENIILLPNAIENVVSEKELSKLINKKSSKRKLDLLFLSNMDISKGWMKLLQSCVLLKKSGLKFNCAFVGAFPGKNEFNLFKNFATSHNLQENISYLGKKSGEEKNMVLSKSDIIIFPTEYPLETFGRVIIEGMMFGIPVVANGIATIPSIIDDEKTGFVLKENKPEEIAEAVLKLKNFNKRKKMGLTGRKKFIKEFELKKFSKRFIKIFETI